MKRVLISVLLCLLTSLTYGKAPPEPDMPRPLVAYPLIDKAPVFKGDGTYHIAYELFLTNLSNETLNLKTLTINGKGYEKVYTSDAMKKLFVLSGHPPTGEYTPILKKGEAGLIFVLLDFASKEEIPPQLENTFIVQFDGIVQTLYTKTITVDFTPPIILSSPLSGEHWLASSAIGNRSDHRRALLVFDGEMTIAQRFAIDWLKYNEEGYFFKGDFKKNENYFGYGLPVIAVADGEIVLTHDGVVENIAGAAPNNLKLNDVMGNFISLKINENAYALYAHLIPGSLKVQAGDKVKKGQILAHLGNSGNSTAPHLHFQITEKPFVMKELEIPFPIFANGIPFAIDHFVKQDYTIKKWDEQGLPYLIQYEKKFTNVRDEIFMENDLVNFSELSEKS